MLLLNALFRLWSDAIKNSNNGRLNQPIHKTDWPFKGLSRSSPIRVSDRYISPDQTAWHINYSWSELPILKYSQSECAIQKLLLIRVSGANITLHYWVRSKLLLTRVSDTYIPLDQFVRYRNYSWSKFLVQTLLLIIGPDQNYSWPESPIHKFLLISVPDTEITPDQSFWWSCYSWL